MLAFACFCSMRVGRRDRPMRLLHSIPPDVAEAEDSLIVPSHSPSPTVADPLPRHNPFGLTDKQLEDSEKYGVEVKLSRIAGAGLGLFATRRFRGGKGKSGKHIVPYEGEVSSTKRDNPYTVEGFSDFFVDASAIDAGIGRFANSAQPHNIGLVNKAVIAPSVDHATGQRRIWYNVKPNTTIEPGEEIYVSYSAGYWKRWGSKDPLVLAEQQRRVNEEALRLERVRIDRDATRGARKRSDEASKPASTHHATLRKKTRVTGLTPLQTPLQSVTDDEIEVSYQTAESDAESPSSRPLTPSSEIQSTPDQPIAMDTEHAILPSEIRSHEPNIDLEAPESTAPEKNAAPEVSASEAAVAEASASERTAGPIPIDEDNDNADSQWTDPKRVIALLGEYERTDPSHPRSHPPMHLFQALSTPPLMDAPFLRHLGPAFYEKHRKHTDLIYRIFFVASLPDAVRPRLVAKYVFNHALLARRSDGSGAPCTIEMEKELRHELRVGLELNAVRAEVPTFVYTVGALPIPIDHHFVTMPLLLEFAPTHDRTTMQGNDYRNSRSIQMWVREIERGRYTTEELAHVHNQFVSVLVQLMCGWSVAADRIGFVPNDAHSKNILIDLYTSEKRIGFALDGKDGPKTYVKTYGAMARNIDYGISHTTLNQQLRGMDKIGSKHWFFDLLRLLGYVTAFGVLHHEVETEWEDEPAPQASRDETAASNSKLVKKRIIRPNPYRGEFAGEPLARSRVARWCLGLFGSHDNSELQKIVARTAAATYDNLYGYTKGVVVVPRHASTVISKIVSETQVQFDLWRIYDVRTYDEEKDHVALRKIRANHQYWPLRVDPPHARQLMRGLARGLTPSHTLPLVAPAASSHDYSLLFPDGFTVSIE